MSKKKNKEYVKKAYGTEPSVEKLTDSKDISWDLHKAVNWYRCNPTNRKKEKKRGGSKKNKTRGD